ncbi:MAG: tetratricopeptide repeat protein [Chloroflexota bacterium]
MTDQNSPVNSHDTDTDVEDIDLAEDVPPQAETPIPLVWRLVAIGVAVAIIIVFLYPFLNQQSDQRQADINTDVAVTSEDEAVSSDTTASVEELFQQGQEFYNNSQWDMAISTYQKVIELEPDYQSAYVNLGDAYYKSERLDLAIETYLKAVDIDPDDADVAYNLGAAYLQQALISGSPDQAGMDKAIAQIEKAIDLNPELPHPHYGLGAAYQILGDIPLSIQHFEKFLELDDGSDSRATSEAQRILATLKASQN